MTTCWLENFSNGEQTWSYYAWGDRGVARIRPIRQVAGPNTGGRSSVDGGGDGVAGTTGKSNKITLWDVLITVGAILLLGGLGYLAYVVITNPDGGESRAAAAMP